MSWRRIWLLTAFDLKHSLLGLRGLLFLIPFSLYWIVMLKVLKSKLSTEIITTEKGLAIASMTLSPEWVEQLLVNNPANLSLVIYVLLTTLPGFILLAACNHLATDAGRKSFRYLLTRASRLEIFFSRNLSVFCLVLLALTVLLSVALQFSLATETFPWHETVQYAGYGLFICLLYSIPFIAFATLFSAFFSGTISSFLSSSTALFILIIVQLWNLEHYPWVQFLLPGFVKESLLGLGTYSLPVCAAALLSQCLLFLGIAWLIFSNRDL